LQPSSGSVSTLSSAEGARVPAAQDEVGFGVYVHWPFCAQKCPYCDFNSHVRHGGIDEARFVAAYGRELETAARLIGPRKVTSIFIGGGTPSLMSASAVDAVLGRIAALWDVASDAEITLEANPSSVEAGRFRDYRAAGVNRVSLGVQSFSDAELKRLGRLHSSAEAVAAISIANDTFERTSFDLIYARPQQTTTDWRSELTQALALARSHLSLYQLTIEPDTPFQKLHAAGKLVVPDPEAALALYEVTQELTDKAGLRAYEISNHAMPGEESRHNLLYWRYGEYVGIGPGAHGRIVADGERCATSTERNPEAWAAQVETAGTGVIERQPLTRAEQADEMLLMGLRLSEGLDLDRVERLSGLRPSERTIAGLVDLGLLETVPSEPGTDSDEHGWMIKGCIGPGEVPWAQAADTTTETEAAPPQRSPSRTRRVRATREGRFILNELVTRLSIGFVDAESAVDMDLSRPAP
jgi:putative oxygen-independent coproporphyrinogen III oxidase